MSLTLYGSLTSPYVRRIRLFMENMDYHFEAINIFDDTYREEFRHISPIKKLPVLKDGDQVIFDSHVIYQHLRTLRRLPIAPLKESNLVSVIDAVTDSNIIFHLSKRSSLPIEDDKLLFRLQRERIPDSLDWLEKKAKEGAFDEWHFGSMCLVAAMDWMEFRELLSFSEYPTLVSIKENFSKMTIVEETMPR